jgi:MFS family permease
VAGLLVDLRPLRRNRNFRLIVSGQLVSLLGSNITMVAIPYQVYRETHASLWVGLTSFIQLPFLILGALLGGAYGDRYDKRRLLMGGSLTCALVDVGLAWNVTSHRSHFVILVALASLLAGVTGFTGPVRSSSLPTILGEEDLIAGYSLNQVVLNFALVVGPSLAGVLLASFSLTGCYLADAITFLVLLVATSFIDPLPPISNDTPTRLRTAIADGFRYVKGHAIAQTVYLADLNAMVFGLPRALFPAMAFTVYHGGPRTLGLLYAAPGIGAVVMAVLTGWVERVGRRGRVIVLAIVSWGAAMTVFGLVHVLWVGVIALGLAGASDVISTVLRNTVLQLAITDEFRSRLSAIQMAVVTGGPRLGDAESGLVAAMSSTEFSIVSGGLACIAGVLLLAWRRRYFWNDVATSASAA